MPQSNSVSSRCGVCKCTGHSASHCPALYEDGAYENGLTPIRHQGQKTSQASKSRSAARAHCR